jgi:hypothetical protein
MFVSTDDVSRYQERKLQKLRRKGGEEKHQGERQERDITVDHSLGRCR